MTVRLCFVLLLLRKEQDGIHMPRGFMDDLKGEVIDEEVHKCAFGYDILFADWGSEYRFLTNIREHRVFCITVITLSTLSKIIFFLCLLNFS